MKAIPSKSWLISLAVGVFLGILISLLLVNTKIFINDFSGLISVSTSVGPLHLGEKIVPPSLYTMMLGEGKRGLGNEKIAGVIVFPNYAIGSVSYEGDTTVRRIDDFNNHVIEILTPEQRRILKDAAKTKRRD